jgi:hypothetical protein
LDGAKRAKDGQTAHSSLSIAAGSRPDSAIFTPPKNKNLHLFRIDCFRS